jgi:hypothetical protein
MERLTPKRRGRRALDDDDPSMLVGVTLPSKQYDDLAQRALREKVSVPEIVRRTMREAREVQKRRSS